MMQQRTNWDYLDWQTVYHSKLKFCMTEIFLISKQSSTDCLWQFTGWVMALQSVAVSCHIFRFLTYLFWFSWLSSSACFRHIFKIFVCWHTFLVTAQHASSWGGWCDCISAVTRSGSDSSSCCLLSFIFSLSIDILKPRRGDEGLSRTFLIFLGEWDFFIFSKGFLGRWARKSQSRPRKTNTFQ